MNLSLRLKRLERRRNIDEENILRIIDQGAFYDELTDKEKERYCLYRGVDQKTLEEVESYLNGNLHFLICRIDMSEAQPIEDTAQEIENYFRQQYATERKE